MIKHKSINLDKFSKIENKKYTQLKQLILFLKIYLNKYTIYPDKKYIYPDKIHSPYIEIYCNRIVV